MTRTLGRRLSVRYLIPTAAAAAVAVSIAPVAAGPAAGHRAAAPVPGTATRSSISAGHRAASSHLAAAAAPAHTVRLAADVLPGLNLLRAHGAAPAGQVLHIGVGLALPDMAAAQAYYRAEYDPASPLYRQFLTPAAFAARFGVRQQTYGRVLSWLRSGGLSIDQTTPAGDWVAASGTVAQLDRLFRTRIAAFHVKGVSFVANTTAPTVPAGDSILSVVGLNTLQRFSTPGALGHRHALPAHRPAAALLGSRSAATPSAPGCLPSCDYGPQDMWFLYNMPATNLAQGQTLAIFGEGRTDDVIANLRGFETNYKLRQVPVTVKHVGPGPFTDDSGQTEWDLDTQSSTGVAPDLYGVDLYFANSLYDASVESLFTAWVRDPNGPKQANASFGECETNPTNPVTGPLSQLPYGTELGDELEPVAEQTLLQAVMEGRTLFSSAGDTGSSCPVAVLPVVGAGNGVANQVVPIDNYPCSSNYAVCVGGTVLWSDGNTPPSRAVERAWEFSGGGAAPFQAEPAFQKKDSAVNIPCLADSGGSPFPPGTICRGAPDVAAMSGDVSDNGYNIYYNGALQQGAGAGTSLSSPLWVGMWSRIQAAAPARRVRTGTGANRKTVTTYPGLGFAAYPIYRVGESSAYQNDFFDVTLGDNGVYHAAPGWDYVTGWGAPDVTNLMRTLDGRLTPVHNVLPPTPTPPGIGSCNALWLNPAHTAADTFGNSDPQLTLLEGNMAPSADGKSLLVKLTVQNLSTTVPTGATAEDWYMTWTYKGTVYFAQAELGALPTSTPTFADGTVMKTGNTSNYQPTHTDSGRFVAGKDGVVEITVPLANVGSPPAGAVLSGPTGSTFIEVGVPPNPTGVSGGSLQAVDTGGPLHAYTVGTTTGTSGCRLPE